MSMSMKASLRNSRTGAKGQLCLAGHNDRTKGGWNYPEKECQNQYFIMGRAPEDLRKSKYNSFEEFERKFYDKFFQRHLDSQNEKNRKKGNHDRIKKDEKGNVLPASEVYLKSKKTAPMETILQVGNKDTPIDDRTRTELTIKAFGKYANQMNQIAGTNYRILDMAMHRDEETPHLHIRGVYIARDKDGNPELAQKKAIQDIKDRHPEIFENAREPVGKKGDKDLIAWTDYQREVWYETIERTAKEMNLDITIDREVAYPGAVHLEPMQYKLQALYGDLCNASEDLSEMQEELNNAKTERKEIQRELTQNRADLNSAREELSNTEKELDAVTEDLENTKTELSKAERKLKGAKALTKKRCEELVQKEYEKARFGDYYKVPAKDLKDMQEAVMQVESYNHLLRTGAKAQERLEQTKQETKMLKEGVTLDAKMDKLKIQEQEKEIKALRNELRINGIPDPTKARKTPIRDEWERDR